MVASSRPLPNLKNSHKYYDECPLTSDLVPRVSYYRPAAWPAATPTYDDYEETPPTILPAGTFLHKGFYDLLAMIPTPSQSRFLWGGGGSNQVPPTDGEIISAGPRHEDINPKPRHTPGSSPLKKGRRVSKAMVSRPTGFVHLVHASDAGQAEALLTRWGPDGLGKLGDPRWADPIKSRVRQTNQAKAVNEVINALKPSQDSAGQPPPLRVMNGMSTTTTSSTITTAARENVHFSPTDGLPGRPGNSTIKWGGGLRAHPEVGEYDDDLSLTLPGPSPRPITPSLTTLEKAVSARIYFENLYFPLLRQPPSREQRRIAMEKDMVIMHFSEDQKEALRAQWRQNETEYLRERRSKVDATAFIKLKTIGHGAFGVVSLVKERVTGQLFAMKQLRKSDMLRKGQEGHVRAERDILKSASLVASPGGAEWIVKLHYSFQDRDNLYLVLEFMGGGDLLNLLIERDIFEEDFARFYVAEMILAIETCHKHGFIHRDIKPDNFLFDPQGHIRLSDFGLAAEQPEYTEHKTDSEAADYEQQRRQLLHKHGIDLEDSNGISDGTRTKRMDRKDVELLMGDGNGQSGYGVILNILLRIHSCGTNSYMSPEVIRGHGYSFSCDWWSLGVIMFECLYGYPPFVSNSRHVTRQKILNWKQSLKFPSRPRVSGEGVNLMQQLLCEPEDRLGSQAPASVSRPDSLAVHARRSGFILPGTTVGSVDGGDAIKAHPWFQGIDWENIHRYPCAISPGFAEHFVIPGVSISPADAAKDPLLRDRVHGEEILNVRKALAFAGFTHKSPRAISYARADRAFDAQADIPEPERGERGRPTAGTGRAISL
ncbi:kinase-like domain-containing protein [Suillus subalutaceus]|uniref:kinase-like domain-containing protein n=1 Tax=Suillus subalutaceus TaxID=48586 RepID=UPI001B86B75A|nr:kinase-like domain-containing protein [Suillus subalutaceus]KAG1862558.1 kinase-like domain-containing protein [Suillus subalutaceus]